MASRWTFLGTLMLVLGLACAGWPFVPSVPSALPEELTCLNDLQHPLGTVQDLHVGAELASSLDRDDPATAEKACDASTNRVVLGYIVYVVAMRTAKTDRERTAKLHAWNVEHLGNPQSAAKLGLMHLLDGGADGKSAKNPAAAAALLGATQKIMSTVGRGAAVDMAAMSVMQGSERLQPFLGSLAGQEAAVEWRREAVVTAFIQTLDLSVD